MTKRLPLFLYRLALNALGEETFGGESAVSKAQLKRERESLVICSGPTALQLIQGYPEFCGLFEPRRHKRFCARAVYSE